MNPLPAILLSGLLVLSWPRALTAQAEDQPSVALPPEFDRVLRDYERAWSSRDPSAVAGLFAEDGFALPSGKRPARGRYAIRDAYAKAGGELRLRALAHASHGGIGWIIGAYGYGEAKGDVGKFVLALRRDSSGRWLIAADIDNSNGGP
jgi:ketosteroid isomerase-like protein